MITKYDASLGEHFHVGGTVSDKLLVFDIDDTLIYSNANVRILDKEGNIVKTLTSSEYNTYVANDEDVFDYSEFESIDLLCNAEVTRYWHTMVREYKKGTHICILTARSNKKMIRQFLLKRMIDIKNALIFCISEEDYPFDGTVHERKAKTIEYLHGLGYDTFVFFDDNKSNLEFAKNIEQKYEDVHVNTVHVKNI